MIDWSASALLLFTLGTAEAASPPAPTRYAQVTVREQILIRVPMRFRTPTPQIQWKESKGPKCVATHAIAGAALAGQDRVDLVLRDRSRVRAELDDDCPALDYYHGFYISPSPDGQICADRDIIRSRVGGQCGIERFRALTAVRHP